MKPWATKMMVVDTMGEERETMTKKRVEEEADGGGLSLAPKS